MKKNILVVEDDELNMKLVCTILKLEGYEVREAFDAESGLEMADATVPDLVVMDIQLPGMNGIEALKILKSCEETSLVPVLAVTGYAMKEDRERCMAAGFDAYMTKPYDRAGFLKTIQDLLDRRS